MRVAALGKKGRISELMGMLGACLLKSAKSFGAAVNTLKTKITTALDARKGILEAADLDIKLATERADVTLPVRSGAESLGRIHPVSQVMDEPDRDFRRMGLRLPKARNRNGRYEFR